MSSSQSGHPTANSLLAALRDGTRGEDSLLERHPLLEPLTSDQLILHEFGIAQDNGEQVVEVVGNTTGEMTYRFEFL